LHSKIQDEQNGAAWCLEARAEAEKSDKKINFF
jgi:hypothetical protein